MKYVIPLLLILFPFLSYGAGTYQCLEATGFTPTIYNGYYEWEDNGGGSSNGSMIERYSNGDGYVQTINSSYSILLTDALGGGNQEFYNNGTTHPNETVSDIIYNGWNPLVGGYVAGTFSDLGSPCPTGGGTTSYTATTTTEQLLATMNFGLSIIIVILFIGVIAFMFNSMKRKKW